MRAEATVKSVLRRYGISVEFTADGCPQISGRGHTCVYSRFTFADASMFGAPGFMVRQCRDGGAEFFIAGERFRFSQDDARPQMEIPKE